MSVEAMRQVPEKRVVGVCGSSLEHQPVSGYSQGHGIATSKQVLKTLDESVCGGFEVGVTGRVHRSLVEDDREFDQKVGQLPG
jgi:hypothetical protein